MALSLRILSLLLALAAASPGPGRAQDAGRQAEQTRIESGDDLGPRAKQVLFRARTRQDQGDHAGAVKILDEWLDGDPGRDHHLLRFQLAINRLALEDAPAALQDLQAAVRLEPRFARAWLRLGETAHGLGQYTLAAEAFATGYQLAPDRRPEFLHYAGACALLGGRADEASRILRNLLTEHRAVATVEWYRALVAASLESPDPDAAGPFVDQLLADRPDDPEAWELSTQDSAAREDFRGAAVSLTVAGFLHPLDAGQWRQLGDLYAVIEVPLQAARCYEKALALEAGAAAGEKNLGDQYERLASAWLASHDLDAARAALLAGLERRPTQKLWALLGDIDVMAEDYAAALDHFGRAVALDPEFGRGHLMMGYCALELDRRQEARRYLSRAGEFPDQADSALDLMRRTAP